ncbi:GntR family transcriptional regulator [Corynebacterium lubricantis]|uniref:GntR family transcriptional regulator n=1 Tax=Corynebacterium lubricantis TaxID=541095 RepID=UPI00035ED421|nr:GntR family transcriptional regulator [Corynebacterium lubricantis]
METLADTVVDHVRKAILSGTMRPNEWYSVTQLAGELGVSRSPAREGLLRLEEAGLIRFSKNRGFQVIESDPSDVAQIFAARLGIEPPAAYRAAKYRTEEQLAESDKLVAAMGEEVEVGNTEEFFAKDRSLHSLIMEMGHAYRGRELVNRLRVQTRMLGHSTAGATRSLQDILDEHRPILEAIRNQDPQRARDEMHKHVTITGRLLLKQAVIKGGGDDGEAEVLWERYASGS